MTANEYIRQKYPEKMKMEPDLILTQQKKMKGNEFNEDDDL